MNKILYFHADWCNRCNFVWREFLLPLIEKGYEIEKINIDLSPQYIDIYTIEQLPTTIVLKDENIAYRRVGWVEIEKVEDILNDTG